jgi:hypothetical protein
MDKLEVSRRQLGTALNLYLNNQDPVSVHVLANSGWTIAEGLAKQNPDHIQVISNKLIDGTELREDEIISIKNKFYNAFKHYKTQRGKERGNDQEIFNKFKEEENDIYLFLGWYDYMQAGGRLPLEAQLLQVWFFAVYPTFIDTPKYKILTTAIDIHFPTLKNCTSYRAKKNLLINKCKSNKLRRKYQNSNLTDNTPLVFK